MNTLRNLFIATVAVAAGAAAWSAPLISPAPAPKPARLEHGAGPPSYGDVAALEALEAPLNLERVEIHPDLSLVGALALSSPDERFGGLSALVWEKGKGLSAVSDRGWRIMGLPDRAAPPPTTRSVRIAPLLDEHGEHLRSYDSDAEGAALDQKGGWLVSFEGAHRIWRYPAVDSAALKVRGAPGWEDLQSNSGLEAIATDPDGTIYAIPERSGDEGRPFPVWRRAGERWETLHLPRTGAFLVTDAAIGPDGKLYVLERSLSLLGGFAMRIRRAEVDGLPDGATLQAETMATLLSGSGVDNMEGMSFAPLNAEAPREDGRPEARLLVVSDDNFRFFQRTLLIEFRLVLGEPTSP